PLARPRGGRARPARLDRGHRPADDLRARRRGRRVLPRRARARDRRAGAHVRRAPLPRLGRALDVPARDGGPARPRGARPRVATARPRTVAPPAAGSPRRPTRVGAMTILVTGGAGYIGAHV